MKKRTIIAIAFLMFALASFAAQPAKGKKYSSPEKAVDAFIAAVRNYNLKTLVSIFGSGSERLFQTEDPVADENTRKAFLAAYDAKHVLADGAEGTKVLVVGTNDWPFPIPIAKSGSKWAFDSPAGFDEIVNRRIGRNELSAIQTCLAIADAQREYYSADRRGDGVLQYAQKFRSTVGMKDGLFWPVQPGEPPSPLGVLVASAADEGYSSASSSYHGYHYKLLTSQGASAPGGAYDYMAHDKQIGGFAILAYPATYGDSGIMSFLVSHSGIVYQRDLGPDTQKEAAKLTSFDPGEGWTKVREKDLEPIPVN